jgi:hypothetical protein
VVSFVLGDASRKRRFESPESSASTSMKLGDVVSLHDRPRMRARPAASLLMRGYHFLDTLHPIQNLLTD